MTIGALISLAFAFVGAVGAWASHRFMGQDVLAGDSGPFVMLVSTLVTALALAVFVGIVIAAALS